ncbi:MAG TPA: DUF2442 domain-containing protein [Roseiflexaceae bacterium]|nr:DUF2442 domain-containing protein [Roseiflexaceae bacterium]
MIRVKAAEVLNDYTVRVTFTNDEQRDIDVTRYINRGGIFTPVHDDPGFFRQVRVELGTIAWPNGADIDPDVLYLGLPPNASEAEWQAAKDRAAHVAH